MNILVILIPLALALGAVWIGGFLWSMQSRQYEDLDGAAHRALMDDDVATDPVPTALRPGTPAPSPSARG